MDEQLARLDKGSFAETAFGPQFCESSGYFALNAPLNTEGDVHASGVRHTHLKIRAIYRVDGEISFPLALPFLIVLQRTTMSCH